MGFPINEAIISKLQHPQDIRKIEQDNCLIIQHIDHKVQFTDFVNLIAERFKNPPLFSTTHEMTYIAGYMLGTHDEYWESQDHIFRHCHNVLNNNYE